MRDFIIKGGSYQYKSSESGRSMVEMLGVLAIVGILSTGAISGYSKAMTKHKINKTSEQLAQIAFNIKNLFLGQKDYQGVDDTQTMVNLNVFPQEMVEQTTLNLNGPTGIPPLNHATGPINPITGEHQTVIRPLINSPITFTALKHPFKDNVDVYLADRNAENDNKAFVIELMGLPAEACSTLVAQNWSNSDESLISVGINTEDDIVSPECEESDTLFCGDEDVSVAEIISACNNKTNNVAFKFY